ncbi:Putative 2EXR domain-containing protein [Colletotrichum destructivum]|uniref:2EXR domain-containing protein n=1 Tax=Colletotrichum destructivum TaxID=34406 RepID=A0AAX4IF44_9PEZI|nr:Putative 2EXR domain-containing protein [Colletotrichum destructivum]
MDAEAATDTARPTPPPPLPDEEAHLRARISDARFWVEFSLFDDGLDAARAAALVPPTLSRFHRFPDLPPEIRLKVWSYLVVPRVVTACCFERDDRLPAQREAFARRSVPAPLGSSSSSSSCTPEGPATTTTTTTTVFNPTCPAILLVCRESRALGLEHYELSFGWKISALLSDTPIARPPRAWFNFRLDALYLAGELEAYDQYGFNSPVVYFLRRCDAARVRHVACSFEALHYSEQGSDQVFGCLWHIVDRFSAARRLAVAVTPRDEEGMKGCLVLGADDNIMHKIWNGWVLGTTVTSSSLADTQIFLVREADLADVMASHATEEDEGKRGTRRITA